MGCWNLKNFFTDGTIVNDGWGQNWAIVIGWLKWALQQLRGQSDGW